MAAQRAILLGFHSAMVKLLMQWDIRAGREQDFSEFVVREFAPRLMQLGIEPSEVLYTMYGEGPQMLTLGAVDSAEKLATILRSSGWEKLHTKAAHLDLALRGLDDASNELEQAALAAAVAANDAHAAARFDLK